MFLGVVKIYRMLEIFRDGIISIVLRFFKELKKFQGN